MENYENTESRTDKDYSITPLSANAQKGTSKKRKNVLKQTKEATLSRHSIGLLVDAIANDSRFKEALHLLRSMERTTVSTEKNPESAMSADDYNTKLEQLETEITKQNSFISDLENELADKSALIEKMQNEIEQLAAQVDNFQQRLRDRNMWINSLSKEKEEKETELQKSQKNAETMDTILNGISACVVGSIYQPLSELELRTAMALSRKNPQKRDVSAIMTAISSLRTALEEIDIGGGYSIEVGSCVDEDIWIKQKEVPFDDELFTGGEIGSTVIVKSRGYRYIDSLGEEKCIKAEVSPFPESNTQDVRNEGTSDAE